MHIATSGMLESACSSAHAVFICVVVECPWKALHAAGDGTRQKLGPEQKQAPRRPSRTSSGLVVKRSSSARPPPSVDPNSSTATDSTNASGAGDPDKGRAVKKSLTQSLNGMARLFGGRKSGEVA